MQQLSGSSGRGGTLMPSTMRIVSGAGGSLGAGPERRDPNMILGVGAVTGAAAGPGFISSNAFAPRAKKGL